MPFRLIAEGHRLMTLLPPYKFAVGLVLDSVLGPAEVYEYVSRTAPSSPPPTIT